MRLGDPGNVRLSAVRRKLADVETSLDLVMICSSLEIITPG
jgi:hypothetical protein